MKDYRVLVIGYRAGLAKALKRLDIPFVLWNQTEVDSPTAEVIRLLPYHSTREAVEKDLAPIRADGPFTHVIAGSEASVVTASHARRLLGTRTAPFAIALRCRDKLTMKQHLSQYDVPMAKFLDGAIARSPAEIFEALGTPVVAKDRRSSGGRNLIVAHNAQELGPSPHHAQILERYVDSPEVSVESFLQDGEVQFESITEYRVKTVINVVPAELPQETIDAILELNRRVLKAMRITWGMTHLELYLTKDGPWFGEVALRPPGGYIMDLIRLAWGFDAWEALVAMELELPFVFPERPSGHASAWVLHPGAGRVLGVEGVEALAALQGVHHTRIKVAAGDTIAPRVGVGDDVGRILFLEASATALNQALDQARSTLQFKLAEF